MIFLETTVRIAAIGHLPNRETDPTVLVICDEAHNLEGVCEDASSFELKPEVIANSIAECDDCIYMLSSEQNEEGAIGGQTFLFVCRFGKAQFLSTI